MEELPFTPHRQQRTRYRFSQANYLTQSIKLTIHIVEINNNPPIACRPGGRRR
jgi:hypothetical protein